MPYGITTENHMTATQNDFICTVVAKGKTGTAVPAEADLQYMACVAVVASRQYAGNLHVQIVNRTQNREIIQRAYMATMLLSRNGTITDVDHGTCVDAQDVTTNENDTIELHVWLESGFTAPLTITIVVTLVYI